MNSANAVKMVCFPESDAAILCYNPLEPKSWSEAISILERVRTLHPGIQAYIAATKLDLMGGKVDHNNIYYTTILSKLF